MNNLSCYRKPLEAVSSKEQDDNVCPWDDETALLPSQKHSKESPDTRAVSKDDLKAGSLGGPGLVRTGSDPQISTSKGASTGPASKLSPRPMPSGGVTTALVKAAKDFNPGTVGIGARSALASEPSSGNKKDVDSKNASDIKKNTRSEAPLLDPSLKMARASSQEHSSSVSSVRGGCNNPVSSSEPSICSSMHTVSGMSCSSAHHHHHHHHHHHAASSRRAKNRSKKKKGRGVSTSSTSIKSGASDCLGSSATSVAATAGVDAAFAATLMGEEVKQQASASVPKTHPKPHHQHSTSSLLGSVAAVSVAPASALAVATIDSKVSFVVHAFTSLLRFDRLKALKHRFGRSGESKELKRACASSKYLCDFSSLSILRQSATREK